MKTSKKPKTSKKDFLFAEIKKDIKDEEVLEGLLIRPAILMTSFITFVIAMFMLLVGNFKWGGSLIIFSFVLNIYTIYQSLSDEKSIFRTLNLVFKLVFFIAEIVAFNWLLLTI